VYVPYKQNGGKNGVRIRFENIRYKECVGKDLENVSLPLLIYVASSWRKFITLVATKP
jgi:hypothetical protein